MYVCNASGKAAVPFLPLPTWTCADHQSILPKTVERLYIMLSPLRQGNLPPLNTTLSLSKPA